MENNYFKEAGLEVEPVKIISANDAANALISGEIVGNATMPLNVILNIERNTARANENIYDESIF
jgi:ABC-type nitrate/sulfonate/bicarbonate transport system substrate-binding protein